MIKNVISYFRALESDQKSLQSLSVTSKHSSRSGHSRQGSVSSMMSNTSISSNTSNLPEDDPCKSIVKSTYKNVIKCSLAWIYAA